MNFLWIFFAILSGLADIGYNLSTRKALKDRVSVVEFSWWMNFIRSLIFLPSLFWIKNLNLGLQQVFILFALGAITFINIHLFMKMHSLTELSLSTIIARLRMVWVPLIAFFLINERLTSLNYLGVFIIFMAVLVVSSPKKIILDKTLNVAFVFSISTSLLAISQKAASVFTPIPLIILVMSLPTVVFVPFITKNPKEKIFFHWNKHVGEKILIAFFGILVAYFFVTSLNLGGKTSATSAIYQGISVFGVAVGIFFLKEKGDLPRKILAGILTLLGIIFLV